MTPEQKQQLDQVIRRHNQQPPSSATASEWRDVDFLLFLVKNQEAATAPIASLKDLHDSDCLHVTHNGACDCAEGVVVNRAANQMRSLCVEKVKAMRAEWQKYEQHDQRDPLRGHLQSKFLAAKEIIKELESVSIQEQKSSSCGAPRPDDGSECLYGVCPRPRDGCSEYCWQHHRSQCVVQDQEAKQK